MAFRSEGDARAWAIEHGDDRGATVPVDVLGGLSHHWYGGRFSDDWRPATGAARQASLREAGLGGAFWELG
ncbi:MAG: hypothetical protein OXE96_09895 [Gemmatimonadetes bacterium]|nr:hypothetical protein [Gemmatimonadota bacterium]